MGETGGSWTEALPGRLDELAGQWRLRLGTTLPGGSASCVVAARTADGHDRVLKLGLPDVDLGSEAAALRAAGGQGHVVLHDHDPAHDALLLERLGPSLDRTPMPVAAKLLLLVDTLQLVWRLPADRPVHDKASSLAAGLTAPACTPLEPGVLARAREYAAWLAASADEVPTVLVHGDPHPANLLRVAHDRPGAGVGWVFVDPESFRGDPAYDLGVVLRDFSNRLLDADTDRDAVGLLRGWCDLVADRAGLDAERVWRWAFLERVSTGLYVGSLGADRVARPFLDSAARLVRAG